MENLQKAKIIDFFTRAPVSLPVAQFKNQALAQRIIHRLTRLERLDEYALDATDVYLTGMLDVLER